MKVSRHAKIVELISQYDVETQEELAELLKKEGFKVTQATVSRDIRDLKLTKVQRQTEIRGSDAGGKCDQRKIHKSAAGRIYIHGYGTEYPGDQNRFRNGHGSGGGCGQYEMAGSGGLYRRRRYDHVCHPDRGRYDPCHG